MREKHANEKEERMVYDCLLGRSQVRGIIYKNATWEGTQVSRGDGDGEGGRGDDDKEKGK